MPPPITTTSRTGSLLVGRRRAGSRVYRERGRCLPCGYGDPARPDPREELLQRRLTRARLALGALGMLVAVCAIAVGLTIWYWISFLRGPWDTPFTRGPYLLRVSGDEAGLRWSTRGNSP